jgi:hypothetical protein
VPQPDRVVNVYGYSNLIGGTTNIAYPHLERLKGLDVFHAVAAFTRFRLPWDSGEGAENVNIELVSENYFDVLHPTLETGRPPLNNGEVLLGHTFWRDRFAANRNVLGQTILLGGERFVITGVMGGDYRGTLLDYLGNPKIWMTLRSQPKLAMLRWTATPPGRPEPHNAKRGFSTPAAPIFIPARASASNVLCFCVSSPAPYFYFWAASTRGSSWLGKLTAKRGRRLSNEHSVPVRSVSGGGDVPKQRCCAVLRWPRELRWRPRGSTCCVPILRH